jgi:hypothetical protein
MAIVFIERSYSHFKRNVVSYSICFITIICFWTSSNTNWGKRHPQRIILADGRGYYAHLPAIFIYNDLNFGYFRFLDSGTYYNPNFYYDYRAYYHGRVLNKYYCGTAIPMLPFFLAAHTFVSLTGRLADGYSDTYQIAINIAAICYLFLALFIIAKLLVIKGFSPGNVALTLLILVFGTNWFYYTNSEPSVSHVYSAFFIPLFFWQMILFTQEKRLRNLVFSTLCLGLIVLIRPINIICVLALPVFLTDVGRVKDIFRLLFKKPLWLIIGAICFFAVVSVQLIIYKIQVGEFFIYSYGDEGFDFTRPHIFEFLFSYKKGLFIYAPSLFISLAGFYFWLNNKRGTAISVFVFLLLLIYVQSSWHMWWYGGSFGSRVQIEFYLLWALLIAGSLTLLRNRGKAVLVSMYTIFCLYCIFQTYQYRYNLLHWELTTKKTYWEIFLQLPK